jgi:uncharacterized integral membrane protein
VEPTFVLRRFLLIYLIIFIFIVITIIILLYFVINSYKGAFVLLRTVTVDAP